MLEWITLILSIRVAVTCLIGGLILRCCHRNAWPFCHSINGFQLNRDPLFIMIWVLGTTSSLIHLLAAMGWVHSWSHQAAVEQTANQTRDLLGISVGIGVYFNYLFVIIWLTDSAWLLSFRQGYFERKNWVNCLIYGYLVFIAFNGAVIFVSGWIRYFFAALFLLQFVLFCCLCLPGIRTKKNLKSNS